MCILYACVCAPNPPVYQELLLSSQELYKAGVTVSISQRKPQRLREANCLQEVTQVVSGGKRSLYSFCLAASRCAARTGRCVESWGAGLNATPMVPMDGGINPAPESGI